MCQEPSKNQIVIGSNDISVFGGNKDLSVIKHPLELSYQWVFVEAYIMEGSSNKRFDRQDIGIAKLPILSTSILPDRNRFFDKIGLKDVNELSRAQIIPICLAALNRHLGTDEIVRGVGWGNVYEESPINRQRKPVYSSCMTNEAGPFQWRFQNCDIKDIRKRGWKCEKDKSPPTYNKGDREKCIQLFDLASIHKDKLESKQLKDVDVMYITDDTIETCYQPALLQNRGWCKLQYQANKNVISWGICSPSCDVKEARVRTMKKVYICIYIYIYIYIKYPSNLKIGIDY